VTGAELGRAIERLRGLGAVILSFQAKGAAYRLNVILRPGELLAEALDTKQ
jgi:DNA-binding transcriptional ArsR family regulator